MLAKGTKVLIRNHFKADPYRKEVRDVAGSICTIKSFNEDGSYTLEETLDEIRWWESLDFTVVDKSYIHQPSIFDKSFVTEIPVKYKKLREDAITPKYAHGHEDSGMDVYVNRVAVKIDGEWKEYDNYYLAPEETVLVKTGLAFAVPLGLELQARPTSGNSLKTMLRVANSPGTIDAGYRGEVGIIITNTGSESIKLNKGDKIAQLVLCPVIHAQLHEVDELPEANRGEDGYGSTGTIKDVK